MESQYITCQSEEKLENLKENLEDMRKNLEEKFTKRSWHKTIFSLSFVLFFLGLHPSPILF